MIGFHRFLITTAILFCAGFAAWAMYAYLDGGAATSALLAVGFGLAAIALGYYLRHLRRFLGGPP